MFLSTFESVFANVFIMNIIENLTLPSTCVIYLIFQCCNSGYYLKKIKIIFLCCVKNFQRNPTPYLQNLLERLYYIIFEAAVMGNVNDVDGFNCLDLLRTSTF